jgi:hypothetical protein
MREDAAGIFWSIFLAIIIGAVLLNNPQLVHHFFNWFFNYFRSALHKAAVSGHSRKAVHP